MTRTVCRGLSIPRNPRLTCSRWNESAALVFDDVYDVDVTACTLEGCQSGEPLVSLVDVKNAIFRSNKLKGKNENFIRISGGKSEDILLKDNFLNNTKNTYVVSREVKKEIVTEIGTVR